MRGCTSPNGPPRRSTHARRAARVSSPYGANIWRQNASSVKRPVLANPHAGPSKIWDHIAAPLAKPNAPAIASRCASQAAQSAGTASTLPKSKIIASVIPNVVPRIIPDVIPRVIVLPAVTPLSCTSTLKPLCQHSPPVHPDAKMQRLHPQRPCRLDVLHKIVHKERLLRRQVQPL